MGCLWVRRQARVLCVTLLLFPLCASAQGSTDAQLPVASANDNRVASGKSDGRTAVVRLEVREATWFPENQPGPNLAVFAFAEEGKAPQIPGPLIRVRQGTELRISVRNLLSRTVTIHGLHTHPESGSKPLTLAPGEARETAFAAGVPGTYAYWASAGGGMWQNRPYKEDSQLAGAFVVDPRDGSPADRIFVLSAWRDKMLPFESLDVATINGKSWPYTERLTYDAGESVRWRILNLSSLLHPMHLHGGYFDVVGTGDGEYYQPLGESRRTAATELIQLGHTIDVVWTPERAGRWLFHCHILGHVTPDIMLFHQNTNPVTSHSAADHMHEMSGMVLGITVRSSSNSKKSSADNKPRRKLELVVGARSGGGMGYGLLDPKTPHREPVLTAPGPPLVLTQGEPVEIRVTNRLNEPTTVHWHGIELDSYYDGVAGWTGVADQVTPSITPGKSFSALFTPPRAGTFIYHTHMNDIAQMSSGLYGPLIVMPPGQTFDPETDRLFVIGHTGLRAQDGKILLNGSDAPAPLRLSAGSVYRFRFINISPNSVTNVLLTAGDQTVQWRQVAKDGADLPRGQAVTEPASLAIAPGETYDFELRTGDKSMRLSLSLPVLKQNLTQEIPLGVATVSHVEPTR